MGISKIVRFALTKVGNHVGYYSKRQSVEAATNIGKELVDRLRTSTELTQDVIQSTIRRHVPHANVNIITDKNAFKDLLVKAGENPDALETAASGSAAMYFNMMGKAKGIYIPRIQTTGDISNFAHEFEHYMYNEHTPKRKILVTSVQKIGNMVEKIKPPKNEPAYEHISLEASVQKDLMELFGIQHLGFTGGLQGVKATPESVTALLNGKNFAGLTTEQRINAYIRAITRSHINPKNKDSVGKIFTTKTVLDDEARAYGVSDAVERYASGSDNITWQGLTADIYRRTSNVLNDEIKVGLRHTGKTQKVVQTGLPTTSYCGERYENPLLAFIRRSFGAADYGEPIVIEKGATTLKPYKPKTVRAGLFGGDKPPTSTLT